MLEALRTLYERLGYTTPDIMTDYMNGYLAEMEARSGRKVLAYLDEANDEAIYTDTLEFLTDEEKETEIR